MQRSLSCLSPQVWHAGSSVLVIGDKDPVQLDRAGAPPLFLWATQDFHTALGTGSRRRDWKVYTDGYAYTVSEDPNLSYELLSWHWHPRTRVDTHLHIGKSHPTHGGLADYHVPSGRVSFEQVARFLLTDLGVTPARDDWDAVLSASHSLFVKFRRWSDHSTIPPDPN